jgi:hypothetical protein
MAAFFGIADQLHETAFNDFAAGNTEMFLAIHRAVGKKCSHMNNLVLIFSVF